MGDSLSAAREGLTIVDLLTYKIASRQRLSETTAYKTRELGMVFEAIEGGFSKEEQELALELVKNHKLWDPKNQSRALDLLVLLNAIDAGKIKIPTRGKGFSKESPRKISEALVILDYLSYKSYSRETLSPRSQEECAKLGMVFNAIKAGNGLSKAGQKAVFQLGKQFLKDRTSDKDLQALLKREALIKTHLCLEDRSECRVLNFRKFRRLITDKISDRFKKEFNSKQSALGRMLNLIRKNQSYFRIFLMPENQGVAVEIFICALDDEKLSDNLNSQEQLMDFLKSKSNPAYKNVAKRIEAEYEAIFLSSNFEELVADRDNVLLPLMALYPAIKDFAESQDRDNFSEHKTRGGRTIEGILERAEAKFESEIKKFEESKSKAADIEKNKLLALKQPGWAKDLRKVIDKKPEDAVIIFTGTACKDCRQMIKENKFEKFAQANPKLKVYWRHMPTIKRGRRLKLVKAVDELFLMQLKIRAFPTIITFQNKKIKTWDIENNKLVEIGPLFKGSQKSKEASAAYLDPDKTYYHPDGTQYTSKEVAAAKTLEQKETIIAHTKAYEANENKRKRKILGSAAKKIENHALKKLKEMGIHGNGVIVLKANILQRNRKSLESIQQKKDGSLTRPKYLGEVYFKYKEFEGKGNMEINAKDKTIKTKNDFENKLNELPLLSIRKKLLSLSDEALGSLFFTGTKTVNGKPAYINGIPVYIIMANPASYFIKIKVSGKKLEIIHE